MRITPMKVLIVIALLGIAGCGRSSRMVSNTSHTSRAAMQSSRTTSHNSYQQSRRSTPRLSDNDIQISNLANSGLILSHDLNSGDVRVDRARWNRMSQTDQQAAARVIQQYQNRNAPKAVTIYAVASQARAY